jgi:hypothetical protein
METMQQQHDENENDLTADQVRIAREVAGVEVPERPPATAVSLDDVAEETMSRELQRLKVDETKFAFQQRRAKLFASSGLFATKGVDGQMAVAQAMVKIELGESMGFSPTESLQGIFVINGVTSIASALRASRMQAAGFSWDIDWLGPEGDCEGCRLWLYFNGKPVMKPRRDDHGGVKTDDAGKVLMEQVSEAFTKADALLMKTTLYEDDPKFPGDWKKKIKKRVSVLEKENWQMSRRNMYFARCVTNLQRFHAAKVLKINMPSTEEVLDMDRGAGDDSYPPSIDRYQAGSDQAAKSVLNGKMAELGIKDKSAPSEPTRPDPKPEVKVEQQEKSAAVALKHFGAINNVPVYNTFPASETVTHGQKVYIRKDGTDTLYSYDSEIKNQQGGNGEWLRVEAEATEKPQTEQSPTANGPRPLRSSRY